jgi:ribose 5-phosphate isomerase B
VKIAFTNDHAALEMRQYLLEYLREKNHEVIDCGVATADSVDYPDLAEKAVRVVLDGKADLAILVCGTGIGMSIAANKVRGIRCALCTDPYSAQMAREHNNANAIALRARKVPLDSNRAILESFLNAQFEGGRHQRRIDKMTALENA